MAIAEKYPISAYNARFNNNLGLLYVHSENWQKAIEYLLAAETLYLKSDAVSSETLFVILNNQSFIYNRLGDTEQSRLAYDKSLAYLSPDSSHYYQILNLKSKARLMLLEGDALSALEVTQACISSTGIESFPKQKGICQLERALAFEKLEDFKAAEQAVIRSIETFVEIEHKRWLVKSHLVYAELLEKQGEYQQALTVYQKYHQQERKQILKEIHHLETAFTLEDLEQERDLLDVQNKLREIEKRLSEHRMRILYIWLVVIGLFVVWMCIRWFNEKRHNERLQDLSYKDALTGVGNRRAYQREIESPKCLNVTQYYRLVLVDLDWFKAINDEYGHEVGDRVLVATACCLSNSIGHDELLVRWGGEEFLILLKDAEYVEARVRALIESVNHLSLDVEGVPIGVSISAGVSKPCLLEALRKDKTIFSSTDQALYQAKAQGRNRAVME